MTMTPNKIAATNPQSESGPLGSSGSRRRSSLRDPDVVYRKSFYIAVPRGRALVVDHCSAYEDLLVT